jgi:hypothetical protein
VRRIYPAENSATAQPFLEAIDRAHEFAMKTVALVDFRKTMRNRFCA